MAQYDSRRSIWITEVKEALREPHRVYQLDLSNQNLEVVPDYIATFPNLVALKLSDNRIQSLNHNLANLEQLEFLELSGNQLSEINFELLGKACKNLDELWLRDNNIQKIDSSIYYCKQLEHLNIGNNQITTIEGEGTLPLLKSFIADNNYLKGVPNFIKTASKLHHLNLHSNAITKFELGIYHRNLENLNLGNNQIQVLSFPKGKFNLKTLVLDWVDLSAFDWCQLPLSIQVLSVEHCAIETFPECLLRLRKLRHLSLLQNEISEIPVALNKLKSLRKIWLSGNPITKLYNFSPKIEVVY